MIVRRDFIREFRRKSHGARWVIIQNGAPCILTHSRREGILRRL